MSDVESSSRRPPIAVIGIACRFPGAPNYQTYWENIRRGRDSVTELPPERRAIDGNWPPYTRGAANRWRRQGGFLDRVDLFDNEFFNISPREAAAMDPQQRLLLEESYRCFEDAGVLPEELSAARTSVFAGHFVNDYAENIYTGEGPAESYGGTGSVAALLANRLSFAFGLTGPSFAVNAACASSHVAIHQACISLIRDESDFALACAANLDFNAHKRAFLNHGRFMSPDGRCKAFDKDANGYVPSEGVAAVLLEPLDRAISAGRTVYAVIRGTALHHVGRSRSLTAPRVESQAELLSAAYKDAGVSPATVDYLEAHGTGTSLGDPIEVEALTRAFRAHTDAVEYCSLGSVKSNIGHTEAAAGLAGLIKVVGMLRYGEISPTLHVQTPNPIIDFESSPFRLALEARPWPRPEDGRPRRAAISSFGFGGAGGHIIIDEFTGVSLEGSSSDGHSDRGAAPAGELNAPRVFLLSAKSRASLQKQLAVWHEYASTSACESDDLDDICGALLVKRVLYRQRFVALARNHAELKQKLAAARQSEAVQNGNDDSDFEPDQVAQQVLRIGEFNGDHEFVSRLRRMDSLFAEICDQVEAALDSLFPEQAVFSRWLRSGSVEAAHAGALKCALSRALGQRLCEGGRYTPDLIYGEGPGRLAAWSLAGSLTLEQALDLGQRCAWQTTLAAAELQKLIEHPHTTLLDPQSGLVQPLAVPDDYLRGLLSGLELERPLLERLKRKALLLSENQYTFIALLRKWEQALATSTSPPITIQELLRTPPGTEDLLGAIVLVHCLRRLNERWGFAETERFADERLYEFLDLVDDGVLTPADAVWAVQNVFDETVSEEEGSSERASRGAPVLQQIESRMRRNGTPDRKKPYRFMRSREISFLPGDSAIAPGAIVLDIGELQTSFRDAIRIEAVGCPQTAIRKLWSALLSAGVESTSEVLLRKDALRHLSLPAYQFAGESYWLPLRSADTVAPVHPLIDENHSSLFQARFAKTIQATHHLLNDHRIGGRKLLPAAAMIEAARAAGAISGESRVCAVADIVFSAPFALDDAGGEHIRSYELRLTPAGEGLEFEFFATPSNPGIEDSEARTNSENDSAEHARVVGSEAESLPESSPFCSGSLEFAAQNDTTESYFARAGFENPFQDLAGIRARCQIVYSGSGAAYKALDARDMRYGPSLRSIRSVRAGHREALAYLKAPDEGGANPAYLLPPAILDGAFQAALLAPGQNDRDPRRVFVPVTIGRVSCHDRVPNEALVYLRQKNSDAQRMVFDLYLGSEAGRLFAVIEDLTMQAVLGHEPAVPGSEDPLAEAARFYSFEMEPLPRAPEAAADSEVSPGAIILFTNGADIPRPGFGAPERPGPIVVTAGSEFEQLDALTVRINPENPEDYATLLEAYPAARTLVVCEDFCRSPASAGMFFAARALQSSKRQSTPLALFRLVTSPDDLIGRAFAGFARSLRREDPRIDCAVLELETNETAGGIDPARIAAVLLREISYRRSAGAVQDMEVRLPSRADQPRSARRWRAITDALEVPELIEGRADFGNSEFAGNPSQGVAGLRRGGVYLITGGAGGVGRTIAKFLVQRYQARVILCGRSPAPSDPLFDGDEHVGYVQADLTDVSDVQNLVADILRRHSTLHGVIHAAGVLEDALFVNKDFGAFQRVLAPKIRGVQNLDDATRDVALDFFVSFSSIVAGLGNVGQCDYALANSYLDAFAGRREGLREAGERHGRSLSIAWPYWKDGGGMRLAPELEAALETSLGIRAITAAGALRAFETLLKSLGALPERVLVASRGDRLPEFDGLRIRESDTTTAPSAADSRSGEADANLAKRVEHDLIQIFARELRTTERKVAPDQPFARYGVDSLLIVRLNATLEKKFGKLPKTLFFEYSNLRDLARYFVANHAKHYSVAEKPPAPPAAQSPIMAGRNAPYAAQRAAPSFVHGRSDSAGALEIAIIGMSGRYPGADDTEEFWRNLRAGRDCITEVPSERWPADLFDENKDRAGKSYSRWGGFVSDADCFDPLFFNISPLEATRMDPQERLFLQTVWNTLEDAGYTPGNIAQTPPDEADGLQANAGVFVGVMWGDYQLFGVQEALKGAAWRRPGRVIGASRTAYRIV